MAKRSRATPRSGPAGRIGVEGHLAAGDAVLLSSPGGDLTRAVIMGEIIRSRGLVTAVGVADASGQVRPAYCVSACVLVYAGGKTRFGEVKPAEKTALPIITFDHDVTVHLNGEEIRALHFPSGHTDGDSVIFFPKSNVVHMGDDFVTYGFPFVDLRSGGTVEGMIGAVA